MCVYDYIEIRMELMLFGAKKTPNQRWFMLPHNAPPLLPGLRQQTPRACKSHPGTNAG